MLKISKALSAGKLENYHKQEFTSPDQSYWSQGQTVQGEWQGQLAEKYGTRKPAISLSSTDSPSSIRMPMARQSNPSSIAPVGMRPSVRRSRFR